MLHFNEHASRHRAASLLPGRVRHAAWAAAALACLAAGAWAQSTRPATAPDQQPQAPAQAEKPPARQPPSIDDLLDVDREKPGEAAPVPQTDDPAAEQSRRELEKQLSEAEVANAFEQAVEQMGVAAELLDARFDPGLSTQRVQEDIIAKLNQLLDQAKKNKSRSSSSSSSSSQQRQQQQQQQNPGQRQQQQANNQDQRNNNPADNRGETDPPPPEQGDINTMMEETRSEWGNLPQRVRDMLLQGRREQYSSLYDMLTQEYYKRLAEEGSP